jgi:hypothetical protein
MRPYPVINAAPVMFAGPRPVVSGPVVSRPMVSGPVVSGPVVSGPVVSGPVVSGPMVYAASLQSGNSMANLQLVGTLREAVGTGVTPGGFDASLHEARFDRGDWPAITYYGLLYPAAADRALP